LLASPVTVADTAANLAAQLDALQNNVTSIAAITVTDSSSLAISANQVVMDADVLNLFSGSYGLAISDTAANLVSNLDILETHLNNLTNITVTDGSSNSVIVSIAQLTADAGVLALIPASVGLVVSDTAANIMTNLGVLETNNARIGSIVINDGNSVNVTASQFAQNIAALGLLSSKINVNDTASNLSSNLDTLENNLNHVGSIAVTDTNSITVSTVQISTDAGVLALLPSGYSLAISDSAANLVAHLDVLKANLSHLTSIAVTDGSSNSVNVNIAQLTTDAGVLALIPASVGLVVSDTAANIMANLSVLETNSARIGSIVINDGNSINVTASQFAQNIAALGLLSSKINVSDTASNLSSNLDTLENNLNHVGSITVTDTNSITVSATQIITDAGVLALIPANVSLLVSDSSANMVANIDLLQTNIAKIKSVTLTDTNTPTLTISGNQYRADSQVLTKINSSNPYNLALTNETISNLGKDLSNSHIVSVGLVNSFAQVITNLTTLQSNIGKISSIALTNSSTPTSFVTASQYAQSAVVYSKITSPFGLTINGEVAVNVSVEAAKNYVTAINVTDSSANIFANLDSLQANVAKIGNLVLNDTSIPTLTLTANQYTNDAAIIAKIGGRYHLNLTGESAANVAAYAHVTGINVSDNAVNLVASLDSLQSNISILSGISLTDASTPTLTISGNQYRADGQVLAKINSSSAYNMAITNETINNLGKDLINSNVVSVGLLNSFAQVMTNLTTLQSNIVKISSIALTDSSAPVSTVTASQYAQDISVFSKITSPFSLTINGELVANVGSEATKNYVSTINVTDSSANIFANLDSLQASVAKIGNLLFNDATIPTVTLDASQYTNDAAAIAKISSPYHLHLTGESAANVASYAHVTAISVNDTAVNVLANLDNLQSHASILSGINLTDTVTPTLSLNAIQVANHVNTLNAISSTYLLSVKDSPVNINALNLANIHSAMIEIAPTAMKSNLSVVQQVNDLNLSNLNLTGDSINEKVYNSTGTELDILSKNGTVIERMYFTHDTEAQLQLIGIDHSIVHLV